MSQRLRVSTDLLKRAGRFFEERGSDGCEGTALIAGVLGSIANHLVIPDQVGGKYPHCYVEITGRGEVDMMTALQPSERYVARIHSHPGEAFHSPTDDANPVLTHDGAVSIVAPYFGLGLRSGLDVCAVFVLRHGSWTSIPAGADRESVLVAV